MSSNVSFSSLECSHGDVAAPSTNAWKENKTETTLSPKALFKFLSMKKKLLNTYVYFIRMEKNSLWAVFMYVYRQHHQEALRTLCLQEQETLSKAYALIFT